MPHEHHTRGMSLIEVVMGVSIMLIVFAALFSFLFSVDTVGRRNEHRTSALHLANEHLETIRALPYDSIGTVDGIPYGTIPQVETISYDGHTFVRRTFIQYVDDAADGLDEDDETIPADYKRVKVELSYRVDNATSSFSMVTNIAPRSQESLEGAGILRIKVNDTSSDPVSNATVHIENFSIATSVDITTYTNASGTVSFPGAWAGAGYIVQITKDGYTSAQTYATSTENPNPDPSALTVAENSTTEKYFEIDLLSSIDLYVRELPVRGALEDSFGDTAALAATASTTVSGGALTLTGALGSYDARGTSTSVTLAPASIGEWLMFRASFSSSTDTSVLFRILYDTGGGLFEPVPDIALPGNGAGFSETPVSLAGLDPSTFDALRIEAVLETSDAMKTPMVYEWALSYLLPDTPYSGLDIRFVGDETIGEDGGTPIPEYDEVHTTDGAGMISLPDLEYDTYTLSFTGPIIAEACPALPLGLLPDTDLAQTLTLTTGSAHSLALQVLHPLATPIEGAEVSLSRSGATTTAATGPCGTAYFPSLVSGNYTATIYAPGLASTTVPITVSGATMHQETLSYW